MGFAGCLRRARARARRMTRAAGLPRRHAAVNEAACMLKPPVCLFWPLLLRRPDFAFFAVLETADVGLVAVNENCADDSDRKTDRRTQHTSHVSRTGAV